MKKIILFLSLMLSTFSMFAQDAPELVCATPYVSAASLEATSAIIFWSRTSVIATTSYTLQYKKCTDTAWTSVNNLPSGTNPLDSNSYTLRNLASCQCYHVRVRTNCSATDVSDWRVKEFKTGGCVVPCAAPTQLFAAPRDSMASLNWSSMGTGRAYVIQWKSRADSVWQTQTSSTNSLTINRLQPCAEYQFRVRTACSATDMSDYTESVKFKTSGCVAPCSTPRDVRVVVSSRTALGITWIGSGATHYEVSYAVGDSAERKVTVAGTIFNLSNISTCKYYKFKVRSICGTSTAPVYSEWSSTVSVLTEGCVRCEAPGRLSYTVTETSAVVKWDTAGRGAITYDVQYMGPRDTIWRTVAAVRGSQSTLTGLTACTWYLVRIKANCNATSSSTWSSIIRFQTTGCTPPCIAPKNVKIQIADTVGVVSWTGTATSSYRLVITSSDGTFTREVTVTGNVYTLTGLARCKTYKLQIKTVCSATSISEIVTTTFETRGCPEPCAVPRELSAVADSNKVVLKWMNMNATKYYVEYKLAVDSITAWKRDSSTTNSLTVSNLQKCKTYLVRVASVCASGVTHFSNATFTTTGCPIPCIAPIELRTEIEDDTTVYFKFNIVAGQSYTVQYRVAGTATWTSVALNAVTTASLPLHVKGLLKCTTYQWRVLRACSATANVESISLVFVTRGCPMPCLTTIREIGVVTHPTDSARVTWNINTAAAVYEVRYGSLLDSAFLTATPVRLTTNTFLMRGLVNCRNYVVQVRTVCANGQVSDWVTKAVRVGSSCFNDDELLGAGLDLATEQRYISEFGVYPNPGTEVVQVAYKLEKEANVKVDLMNLQGQVVNRFDGGNQEVGNYVQTLDNLTNLHNGIYLIVISANGKVVNTQKWQKQ